MIIPNFRGHGPLLQRKKWFNYSNRNQEFEYKYTTPHWTEHKRTVVTQITTHTKGNADKWHVCANFSVESNNSFLLFIIWFIVADPVKDAEKIISSVKKKNTTRINVTEIFNFTLAWIVIDTCLFFVSLKYSQEQKGKTNNRQNVDIYEFTGVNFQRGF